MYFHLKKAFPYPPVEYIPLTVTTIARGRLTGPGAALPGPALLVEAAWGEGWRNMLKARYGICIGNPNAVGSGDLVMLAVNVEVVDAKYRGTRVTMIGIPRPGTYHLFSVPRKYFYKPRLFFEVYSPGEERLAWDTYCL